MSKTTISDRTPRPMTPEAIEKAARADRDAQPLTEADLKRMKRTPQAKIIRRALELTQEEFADRDHIPHGTLRDWEQGRAEPDQPTKAYLMLIARDPNHVNRILNSKPHQANSWHSPLQPPAARPRPWTSQMQTDRFSESLTRVRIQSGETRLLTIRCCPRVHERQASRG
jgi:putative transcriptional regulator